MLYEVITLEDDRPSADGARGFDGAAQVRVQQSPLHEGRRQGVGRSSGRKRRSSIDSHLMRSLLGGHRVGPHHILAASTAQVGHAPFELVQDPVV